MQPMQALSELRGVLMTSILPVPPAHALGLLDKVGEGLAESDTLREQLANAEASSTPQAQQN